MNCSYKTCYRLYGYCLTTSITTRNYKIKLKINEAKEKFKKSKKPFLTQLTIIRWLG